MLRRIFIATAGIVLYAAAAFALSDVRGSRDHALFPRPAGYRIVSYSSGERSTELPRGKDFDFLPLDGQTSGRHVDILYKTEGRPLSRSALGARFLSALKKAGGEVVFQENSALGGSVIVGRLRRPGRDVRIMQDAGGGRIFRLLIVESPQGSAAPPPVVAVSDPTWETEAQVLDLLHLVDRSGRLEFPVKFAPGSSVPLKGYEANFQKCVLLLEKDPALRFRVSTWADAGMKPADQKAQLSSRTAALIDAMTRMGAAPGRLTAGNSQSQSQSRPQSQEESVPAGIVRLTVVDSIDDETQEMTRRRSQPQAQAQPQQPRLPAQFPAQMPLRLQTESRLQTEYGR
ncbi:MAG: hypothetical protein LBQ90_02835 [Synergistaceae bacterium]|jgi:hypothetical protein|nr:hypothetical protein [Synergistaceae bacterium]